MVIVFGDPSEARYMGSKRIYWNPVKDRELTEMCVKGAAGMFERGSLCWEDEKALLMAVRNG